MIRSKPCCCPDSKSRLSITQRLSNKSSVKYEIGINVFLQGIKSGSGAYSSIHSNEKSTNIKLSCRVIKDVLGRQYSQPTIDTRSRSKYNVGEDIYEEDNGAQIYQWAAEVEMEEEGEAGLAYSEDPLHKEDGDSAGHQI